MIANSWRSVCIAGVLFAARIGAGARAGPRSRCAWWSPSRPAVRTDIAVRSLAERLAPALGQPVVVREPRRRRRQRRRRIRAEAASPTAIPCLPPPTRWRSQPAPVQADVRSAQGFRPGDAAHAPAGGARRASVGGRRARSPNWSRWRRRSPAWPTRPPARARIQHMAGEWFAQARGHPAHARALQGRRPGDHRSPRRAGAARVPGQHAAAAALPRGQAEDPRADHRRSARASLPEVPTYEEAGLQELVLEQWLGLFFVAGTPARGGRAPERRGAARPRPTRRCASATRRTAWSRSAARAEQFARQYARRLREVRRG